MITLINGPPLLRHFGRGHIWWIYDDDKGPVSLPQLAQENVCLLWLSCGPHGGAEDISKMEEEFPIISHHDKLQNILLDPSIHDGWHRTWLQALDLDIKLLI